MAKGLSGKNIVLAASRKTEEMCTIIEKQGGTPSIRSLQGTVFLAEKEVEPSLRKFVAEGTDWSIFTTGIGTETLVEVAEKIGVKEEFLSIVKESKVASRGYKTLNALKKLEIKPIAVDEDGTTQGLSRALEQFDFTGQKVMIQLHGETAPTLTKFLEDKGATVHQILPYQHIAPEPATVQLLCDEIEQGKVDAICFTTAIQVRSLFLFAKENGLTQKLLTAFQGPTLAVAVGKVTAEALKEEGVERYIAPENERMGAMIMELSRYYEEQR